MADTTEEAGGASSGERTLGPDGMAAPAPGPSTRFGRYEVLSKLGSGGMGVVFAANDPKLDRKVAVKLLKSDESETSRVRLQREAQALALLSHPNVVTVHDVGVHKGRVFVAMEFLEGQTLGAWGKSTRPWREVLRIFDAAGRGLAAAHEAGLVHRDFKPDNVMIGSGDPPRVTVMDFGLALATETETRSAASDDGAPSSLTKTGALMGTPAYMAPEQFAGRKATARSDQFSFCVAFYEALYGTRPFAGRTVPELTLSVSKGEVRVPGGGAAVPQWLGAAVRRGLGRDPETRFESMSALLAALRSGATRQRRRRLGIGLVGLAAVAGAAYGLDRWNETRRIQACAEDSRTIDLVWNPDVAESVRSGLLATGAEYAPVVAERVMPWIDAQTETLREHTRLACIKGTVEDAWDAPTLAKARWCVDQRRFEVSNLVEQFADADEPAARHSVSLAAGLPRVEECTDEASLASMPKPPSVDVRPTVEAIQRDLSRVQLLGLAARFKEALTLAVRARERATPLSWGPLTAAALTAEARALGQLQKYAEAEKVGTGAYLAAVESGAWSNAASAAVDLVDIVGVRLHRYDDGRTWADHAATAIARAGDPIGLRRAARWTNLGNIAYRESAYAKAIEKYEVALATTIEAVGAEHPRVAIIRNNLGNALDAVGEYEAAMEQHTQAIAMRRAALGPRHPDVARSLGNLGAVLFSQRKFVEARARFTEALAIEQTTEQPRSAAAAHLMQNIGAAELRLDETEHAAQMMGESLAIREELLGPDHPDVAKALYASARAHTDLGHHDQARTLLERAVAIQDRALAPDHLARSEVLLALGLLRAKTGDPEGARGLIERALAIRVKVLDPTHRHVIEAMANLGRVLAELGEWGQAMERLEQARASATEGSQARAHADFQLARVLWNAPRNAGRDRERSHVLAAAARDAYVLDPFAAKDIEAWLVAHPLPD